MLALLMASTLLGVCSSSWLMIWVCLEINTILMCSFMSKEMKKWKLQETPTLMYYLIQVMASIVILISSYQEETQMTTIIMIMGLLTKMGAWPVHAWYLKLISVMEMKQMSMLVIMTWQKIMPVVFICSLTEKMGQNTLIGGLVVLTLLVPLTNLLYNLSIKSILALSSFNNNGWLLAAALTSQAPFWVFLGLYSTTLALTLKGLKALSTKSLSLTSSFWATTMIVSNMGGLPPMTMFWAKIMVVKSLLPWAPTELIMLLMLTACYLLYHYLWMVLNEVSQTPVKAQNPKSTEEISKITMMVTTLSISSFVVALSLGLTKKDLSW